MKIINKILKKLLIWALKASQNGIHLYKDNNNQKQIIIMEVTKQANQSVLDILLKATGMMEGAIRLLRENNISITQECPAGTNIVIPCDIPTDDGIVNYYNNKGICPATGYTDNTGSYYGYFGVEGIGEELLDEVLDFTKPNPPSFKGIYFKEDNKADLLFYLNGGDNLTPDEELRFETRINYLNDPVYQAFGNENNNNVSVFAGYVLLKNVDITKWLLGIENDIFNVGLLIYAIDKFNNKSQASDKVPIQDLEPPLKPEITTFQYNLDTQDYFLVFRNVKDNYSLSLGMKYRIYSDINSFNSPIMELTEETMLITDMRVYHNIDLNGHTTIKVSIVDQAGNESELSDPKTLD